MRAVKTVVFSLIPAALLVVCAELTLRWTGAAERCPGYEGSILWVCDPVLYFKTNPGIAPGGKPISSLGLRGGEREPKPEGVRRIVALGDSATFGVISPDPWNGLSILDEPYPERLQKLADVRLGPGRMEVVNAGVAGYNSYQALLFLRRRLRPLKADVITVRLGWNDLFLARGDDSAFRESDSAIVRAVEDVLLRTALYPFSRRLGIELRHRFANRSATGGAPALGPWRPAVSVDVFERNLRRIVEIGRSDGAEVWLITSADPLDGPEARARYRAAGRRSSAHLTLGLNRIESFARLAEIHARYNDAVRRVAAETGAKLVDMAALYRKRGQADLFGPYDVVHPNDAGHQLEAEVLFDTLTAGVEK